MNHAAGKTAISVNAATLATRFAKVSAWLATRIRVARGRGGGGVSCVRAAPRIFALRANAHARALHHCTAHRAPHASLRCVDRVSCAITAVFVSLRTRLRAFARASRMRAAAARHGQRAWAKISKWTSASIRQSFVAYRGTLQHALCAPRLLLCATGERRTPRVLRFALAARTACASASKTAASMAAINIGDRHENSNARGACAAAVRMAWRWL